MKKTIETRAVRFGADVVGNAFAVLGLARPLFMATVLDGEPAMMAHVTMNGRLTPVWATDDVIVLGGVGRIAGDSIVDQARSLAWSVALAK